MTASGATEHYGLSQYESGDKPTYTGDYNSDMAKIDAAIHKAAQTGGGGGGGGGGGLSSVAVTAPLSGTGTADDPISIDLSGYTKVAQLDAKADKSYTPPELLGLSAKQLDELYVDESGIIRVPLS